MKIVVTHSSWPWIAVQAGFLLTRFEVGRDGKTAYERLEGKSANVQGVSFAEGILAKKRGAGGPHGKLTGMWKDGVKNWASKKPREKSSWRTRTACGSQERSGGRQRGKDGTDAIWR